MSKIDIAASRKAGYLVEQDVSTPREYALMLLLLAIAFVVGTKVFVAYFSFETGHTEKITFVILLVFTVALIIALFFQINANRKFVPMKYQISKGETREALRNLAISQDWRVDSDNIDFLKAETKSGILVGMEILIIYGDEVFYVNIRLSQSVYGRFPFVIGKKKLIKQIEQRLRFVE